MDTVGVEEEAKRQKFRRMTARSRLQSIYRMLLGSKESLSTLIVKNFSSQTQDTTSNGFTGRF
jgi:hypothetical protein